MSLPIPFQTNFSYKIINILLSKKTALFFFNYVNPLPRANPIYGFIVLYLLIVNLTFINLLYSYNFHLQSPSNPDSNRFSYIVTPHWTVMSMIGTLVYEANIKIFAHMFILGYIIYIKYLWIYIIIHKYCIGN